MAEPFIGQVSIFPYTFVPKGWAACDGQVLPINQNGTLYALLGTQYGGDGRTTFALPDLRGRVPMHKGNGYYQGVKGGEETHRLAEAEMPAHSHQMNAYATPADSKAPDTASMLAGTTTPIYGSGNPVSMAEDSILNSGGGNAHENMMPYLALTFCIAMQGTFPSRN